MTQEQPVSEIDKRFSALADALNRDVYCLFGLPVDNHTLASTKATLRERIAQERQTVLSTVNVNWVAQSLRDRTFRQAILNSDMVVIDGKPLLWLSKLLGCPMRETVPGSTLIDDLLIDGSQPPLSIFIFGGDGNAAELAMQRINEHSNAGLKAVGALNPGFGSVEEMSRPEILDQINAVHPDILLVALGAKKGTQWIEHNRDLLHVKVISHLGATVNFLAGTVQRAPRFVQASGLEWVWRIVQEPKLFKRYLSDGIELLQFIVPRIPTWFRYRNQFEGSRQESPYNFLDFQAEPDSLIIRLPAYIQAQQASTLRQIIREHANKYHNVSLNFGNSTYMDSAFAGLILLLQNFQDKPILNCSYVHFEKLHSWLRLLNISLLC